MQSVTAGITLRLHLLLPVLLPVAPRDLKNLILWMKMLATVTGDRDWIRVIWEERGWRVLLQLMGQDEGEESVFVCKTLLVPWLPSLPSSQNKNRAQGFVWVWNPYVTLCWFCNVNSCRVQSTPDFQLMLMESAHRIYEPELRKITDVDCCHRLLRFSCSQLCCH